MMKFKARVAITSLLSLTLACVSVAWPGARAEAATSKKASKKSKKDSSASSKKITAKSIVKWHRAGETEDEILARVAESGYTLRAKDKSVLAKGKVPKSLIARLPKEALEDVSEAPVASKKGVKALDLKTLTRPEDIDFDSVPPPKGMPKEYVTSSNARAAARAEPEAPAREKPAREAVPTEAVRAEKTARTPTGKKGSKEPVAAAEKPAQRRVVFSASE